ncbi:hypothetical protein [Methanolacinia paynteri]|uniref:hypothetical protein n=1 Tax=Methanolacinia paynteri TaxID=230356 RepID=UPI00064F687A|nr:hypothetical protein [Methanolacinia paynteri]
MPAKPWASAAWKKQREKLLENAKCAWCGSAENLIIHHTHKTRNAKKSIERPIIKDLIREKVDSGEVDNTKTILIFRCPECGSSQEVKGRVTTTCKNCRTKVILNQVEKREATKPDYYLGRDGYKQFIKQYSLEIKARVEAKSGMSVNEPDYIDLECDTIVLCNRCHFALHNGMHLCPACKQRYTKYSLCYSCLPEEEKRKIHERGLYIREIEEEDLEADRWFAEFESASPERREEMLREEDENYSKEIEMMDY